MTKKEFTNDLAKKLNEESDIELIERLASDSHMDSHVNTIKAILDKRGKKINQQLVEVTQKSNAITGKQNWIMIALTVVLIVLTIILLIQ